MNLVLLDNPATQQVLAATTPAATHLRNVLKVQAGATFWCGVKNGARGVATVESVSPAGDIAFRVDWESAVAATTQLPPVSLLVGLPRPQTAKKVIALASEIGCATIAFFVSDNGDPAYAKSLLWHDGGAEIDAILKKSAEQACATFLPRVTLFDNLRAAMQSIVATDNKAKIFALDAYENDAKALPDVEFVVATTTNVVLAVGSERGWSATEREILRTTDNCEFARLGPRILRVENAVAVALSVALAKLGFLRQTHTPLTRRPTTNPPQ
ncbi:MAG: 16S rRNA (uracil(1498)-N(3))-methyltransferase [Opitutae bacterium]|nr:16S rRNA (uracil(1498)-N(3))-methyltransferase [Opitutae bacterium]